MHKIESTCSEFFASEQVTLKLADLRDSEVMEQVYLYGNLKKIMLRLQPN